MVPLKCNVTITYKFKWRDENNNQLSVIFSQLSNVATYFLVCQHILDQTRPEGNVIVANINKLEGSLHYGIS